MTERDIEGDVEREPNVTDREREIVDSAAHEADVAEGEEAFWREQTPSAQRGRGDDFWEPSQSILDDPPDAEDHE